MKTVLIGLVLLILAAWLWLVASLATPETPNLVWTVSPAGFADGQQSLRDALFHAVTPPTVVWVAEIELGHVG